MMHTITCNTYVSIIAYIYLSRIGLFVVLRSNGKNQVEGDHKFCMVNFLVFEIIIPVSVKFYISCIFQNCIMLQKYGTMMISLITTYRKSFSVEGYRYIKPIFI